MGGKIIKPGAGRRIYIKFVNERLPDDVAVYFTSDRSSFGVFDQEWFDGEPHKEIVYPGSKATVILKQVEFTYLKDYEECSLESFLEQWRPYLARTYSSSCVEKCTSWTFLRSKELPLCAWNISNEIRECNREAIKTSYKKFKIIAKRPCHILEYTGKKIADGSKEKTLIKLGYNFAQPGHAIEHKEQLVYDMADMVGSIGGTLGMCIGFSFTGITSAILGFIRDRMKTKF